MPECYFDNAASTKPFIEVIEAYQSMLSECYANPSSLHIKGTEAMSLVKGARNALLESFGLRRGNVIFTSGATESANLAISGIFGRSQSPKGKAAVASSIEHPCVSETLRYWQGKGLDVVFLPVDAFGQIDTSRFIEAIKPSTMLVSIIWVNNEFGSVQNIGMLAKAAKEKNKLVIVHCDCVQGFGKIKGDFSNVDLITISAHKFHGLKGIGALITREGLALSPIIFGGGQQDGIRSGTINAPAIYAMNIAIKKLFSNGYAEKLYEICEYCYRTLNSRFGAECWNSHKDGFPGSYAPNIFNLSFTGLKGEIIVHMLEEDGIYISTSSACSSASAKDSSPLYAIGCQADRVEGAIRISLSAMNTKEEVDYMADKLEIAVARLSRTMKGAYRL